MFTRAYPTLSGLSSAARHWISTSPSCSKRPPTPYRPFAFAQKQYFQSSSVPRGPPRKHRPLATLNPAQLESSGQQILHFSKSARLTVYLKGVQKRWQINYDLRPPRDAKFPPHAQGVLYYRRSSQEIRLRLCPTVQEFDKGTDLLLPDNETWSIFLPQVLRKFSEAQRSAILDLISDERLSLSNWHIRLDRHVTTFLPTNFASQEVIDLSGRIKPSIYIGPTGSKVYLAYRYTGLLTSGIDASLPFPVGSVGVFYYKQSTYAPTHVGELRFRLCSNILSFDQGTDLLLPSGDYWHVNSEQLSLVTKYGPLRDLLSKEGLLDCCLYTDTIRLNASVVSAVVSPHLLNFSQPFIVDLGNTCVTLHLWMGSQFEPIPSFPLFNPPRKQGGKPAYRGRALVRLELLPQSLLDLSRNSNRTPLFALRFLEMLTPIEPNPGCNDSSYMARPAPGQLYMKQNQHTLALQPWAYKSSSDEMRQSILRFTQTSSEAQG